MADPASWNEVMDGSTGTGVFSSPSVGEDEKRMIVLKSLRGDDWIVVEECWCGITKATTTWQPSRRDTTIFMVSNFWLMYSSLEDTLYQRIRVMPFGQPDETVSCNKRFWIDFRFICSRCCHRPSWISSSSLCPLSESSSINFLCPLVPTHWLVGADRKYVTRRLVICPFTHLQYYFLAFRWPGELRNTNTLMLGSTVCRRPSLRIGNPRPSAPTRDTEA